MIRHTLRRTFLMLSWVPVAVTFNQTVGYVTWIQGYSMRPALNPDESLGWRDMLFMWKYGIRDIKQYKIGDLVMLRSPLDPSKVIIKRVVGLPDDVVVPTGTYPKRLCTVPPSHIWIEGDNSSQSIDSNTFGPVSIGLVTGKAGKVIFPPSRFGDIPPGGREARAKELVDEDEDEG